MKRRLALAIAAAVLVLSGCAAERPARPRRIVARRPVAPPPMPPMSPAYVPWGEHTVATRLTEIGPRARARWKPFFDGAGIAYPPLRVEIVAFKRERKVEIYAGPSSYRMALLRSVPIQAASGGPGPKLREGDRQVPEGRYALEKLNPNSLYHVALRLDYPNAFDLEMAERDHRHRLGGDIMIHGSDRSIGCIAVGDQVAEDLFVIAADAGIENVAVLIVPRDFRRTGETEPMPGQPAWVTGLYGQLERELLALPLPRPVVPGRRGTGIEGDLTSR